MKQLLIELDDKTYESICQLCMTGMMPLEDCTSIIVSSVVNNLSQAEILNVLRVEGRRAR